MIKVKHPFDECNKQQEEFLSTCHTSVRRFYELMFTHGNITYRYHQDAGRLQPTEEDFKEWLLALPENMKKAMQAEGYEACKRALPFTRFIMEKNDVGLEEYIQLHMDPEDYTDYKSMLNKSEKEEK